MNLKTKKKKTEPEEQETEPQGDHSVDGHILSHPEAQPDPVEVLIDTLNKQEIRIREMEKSQTELLQYLQEKFKNEGQQQQGGDGTLGQLASIADKIVKGDQPQSTDQKLAQVALDNLGLMNKYLAQKIFGKIDDVEEPSHRTV